MGGDTECEDLCPETFYGTAIRIRFARSIYYAGAVGKVPRPAFSAAGALHASFEAPILACPSRRPNRTSLGQSSVPAAESELGRILLLRPAPHPAQPSLV